jgi:quercetin dioxygenase-like cupin family protein
LSVSSTAALAESLGTAEPQFAQTGFLGPVPILTGQECREVRHHLRRQALPAPADWHKGQAVTDFFFFSLATRPRLISQLVPLLGPDIVLWGASAVTRKPEQRHLWHTDIESSDPAGGFISVWIGIENTSQESALQMIPGSQRYGKSIQEAAQTRGMHRSQLTAEAALELARQFDSRASMEQPETRDGDALIFDGRLWHGSHNSRAQGTRTAILLQYAATDRLVRIPDFEQLEWPFRFLDDPKPPVIAVHGKAVSTVNRIVAAPSPADNSSALPPLIRPLDLPLAESPERRRAHYHLFRGSTGVLEEIESHVSVLSAGQCPHPPHIHPEEELLIILEGEADIVLATDAEGRDRTVTRLKPGSFTFYPSGQYHTIENPVDAPVTYLMLKWRAKNGAADEPLGTRIFRYSDLLGTPDDGARKHLPLFERPTAQLRKLRAHVSIVPPGGGYDVHTDPHDVAIIVLAGRVEVLDENVVPHGVIYCPAGTAHGLRNTGTDTARYLVFEFHGDGIDALPKPPRKRPFISTRRFRRTIARLADRLGKLRSSSRAASS